jgi:tRNA A-37 threonylcarbamoyl transferase component Bud32
MDAAVLAEPDVLLWQNLGRPIKLSHTAIVVEAPSALADHSPTVVLKQFRKEGLLQALRAWCFGGRAGRAWRGACTLAGAGVPTPSPLGMRERIERGFRYRGYLLAERIADSTNLHLYAWQLAEQPIPKRFRPARVAATCLGRVIGRMHSCHVFHGDLKGSNVLISASADPPRVYLIDTDDVRRVRRGRHTARIKDLARLATSAAAHPWISRTLLCRFLHAYCAEHPRGEIDWKELWREVAFAARRQIVRKQRRGDQVL